VQGDEMISQKKFLWVLVLFLQIILFQDFSYCQNLTSTSLITDNLNSSVNVVSFNPLMKDTSTLPVLPEQKIEGITSEIQNFDSPAALKAGQLQNIRKIYQFEHEIYNEILQHQKNVNVT